MDELPPLTLGDLRFEESIRTRKRLFGRRPKLLLSVKVSLPGHAMEFDYADIRELGVRPILIEAVSSKIIAGDYFLVSPSMVEPSSAVGASLDEQRFNDDSVLLLHGNTILAEITATQQTELIAWLQRVSH